MTTFPDSDRDTELLIAYLDGELERHEAQRIEKRLAADDAFRQLMLDHQQAWTLLDALPRTELSEDFTQSTVEMVAVQAEEDARDTKRRSGGSLQRLWMATTAVAVLVAFATFSTAAYVADRSNREFVQRLPVLQDLDALERADSLEFVQQLHELQLFADDPIPSLREEPSANLATMSAAERRRYVNQLTPAEQRALEQRQSQFEQLSPKRREELTALHQRLSQQGNADALRRTLLGYNEWLQRMRGSDRMALLAQPTDERLKKVASQVREYHARRIPESDWQAIREWAIAKGAANREAIFERRPELQRIWTRVRGESVRSFMLAFLYLDTLRPSDEDLAELVAKLSPSTSRKLQEAEEPRDLLRKWWQIRSYSLRARGFQYSPDRRRRGRGGDGRPRRPQS